MLGRLTRKKCLPAARAQRQGGFFLFLALRFHQRDQLAGNERERHEDGGQHNARHRKNNLQIMPHQPGPEQPLQSKQQNVNQSRETTGETDSGRSIKVISRLLPLK